MGQEYSIKIRISVSINRQKIRMIYIKQNIYLLVCDMACENETAWGQIKSIITHLDCDMNLM